MLYIPTNEYILRVIHRNNILNINTYKQYINIEIKYIMHMKYMYIHFTCMSVLPACGLCIICVPVAHGSQKKVRIPGIGITDDCEPPTGCWELSPGCMPKQQVFLSLSYLSSSYFTQHFIKIYNKHESWNYYSVSIIVSDMQVFFLILLNHIFIHLPIALSTCK